MAPLSVAVVLWSRSCQASAAHQPSCCVDRHCRPTDNILSAASDTFFFSIGFFQLNGNGFTVECIVFLVSQWGSLILILKGLIGLVKLIPIVMLRSSSQSIRTCGSKVVLKLNYLVLTCLGFWDPLCRQDFHTDLPPFTSPMGRNKEKAIPVFDSEVPLVFL